MYFLPAIYNLSLSLVFFSRYFYDDGEGLKPTKQEHGLFQFLTGGKNNCELKLWSVAPHGNIAASPAPHQMILFPHQPESSHESLLLSIIPGGEFLIASDSTQNLFYSMHLNYNSDNNVAGLAKIDYLRLVVRSSFLFHLYMLLPRLTYINIYQKALFG